LLLEPLPRPLLHSGHRLGQRVRLVVLDNQSAVVQRPDHEAEALLVANLDMPVPDPLGDGGERLGNIATAWRKHDYWARTCLAHLPEKVLIDFLYLGQSIVNRGCDAKFVQVPKQL